MAYEKISYKEYHQRAGLNQSTIKRILDDPNKYALGIDTNKKTEAMNFGALCHDLLLSPAELGDKYLFSKFDTLDFRKKECKDERADAEKLGLILVDRVTLYRAKLLLEYNNDILNTFFNKKDGDCELSLFKKLNGRDCKARFDFISNDKKMICDLKIMQSAKKDDFIQSIAKFGYHIQAAFYMRMTGATSFYFIVIEKEPPFMCGVYELDISALDLGRERINNAFDILANISHYQTNCYSYFDKETKQNEVVQMVGLPTWAFYQS